MPQQSRLEPGERPSLGCCRVRWVRAEGLEGLPDAVQIVRLAVAQEVPQHEGVVDVVAAVEQVAVESLRVALSELRGSSLELLEGGVPSRYTWNTRWRTASRGVFGYLSRSRLSASSAIALR